VKAKLCAATKELKEIQKQDRQKRDESLRHRLQEAEENAQELDDPQAAQKAAKSVEAIIRGERRKASYDKIRQAIKPTNMSKGLDRLDVPKKDLNGHIVHDSDGTEMRKILLEADDIHKALLERNKNHFRKAADTPFGSGDLYDLVGFTGLNEAADAIVAGTFMEEYGDELNLLPETEQLIAELAMPEMIKNLESDIPTEVGEGEYIDGFKKWTESTSTSPSGRHLGHYKAIVNDPLKATRDLNFVDLYVKAINLPLKYGFVPSRWCNSVTVMIEKDPGSPRIERLRIIHLFKADYNFCLKLLWGCRMVY